MSKKYIFDVTDLALFYTYKKYSTGIQRVVIELLKHFYKDPEFDFSVTYYHYITKKIYVFHKSEIAPLLVGESSSALDFFGLPASGIKLVNPWAGKYRFKRKIKNYIAFLKHASKLKEDHVVASLEPKKGESLKFVMLGYPMHSKLIVDHVKSLVDRGLDVQPILYIHDVIPLLPKVTNPTCSMFRDWLKHSQSFVKHYICNSKNTCHDLYYQFDGSIDEHIIETVPLCHEFTCVMKDFSLVPKDPYFLFVGDIGHRRNGFELIQSFKDVIEALPNSKHKLIFAGHQGRHELKKFNTFLAENPSVKGRIEIFSNVSDSQLSALYSKAYYTVVSSLYEGWGFPAGESLWHGTPCICADNSSLPEVAEKASLYFDPFKKGALKDVLHQAITNTHQREVLLNYLADMKLRTWCDVASDLKRALEVIPFDQCSKEKPQKALNY